MSEKMREELEKAFRETLNDEKLNNEELSAIEGASNFALGDCGDTNTGNCVLGCACTISKPDGSETAKP